VTDSASECCTSVTQNSVNASLLRIRSSTRWVTPISTTIALSSLNRRPSMTSPNRVSEEAVSRNSRVAISLTSSAMPPSTGTCTAYFAATFLIIVGVTASDSVISDASDSACSISSRTRLW
jgi:hypothetical protein